MNENVVGTRVKLAIVGCGAAARQCHVPGLPDVPDVELVALVDPVESNARRLAAAWATVSGATAPLLVATDVGAVTAAVTAAVIASPHDTHAKLAVELARAKIHCLVEKPMALSPAECDAMSRAARENGVVLAVAHVRRLFPASRWVKALLAGGSLGKITEIVWREGAPYDWPLVTPSLFHRRMSGGGVLADGGPHVLDLLLWFLGADGGDVVSCRDSSLGGAESEVTLDLRIDGVRVSVTLSRLRMLQNTCLIRGLGGSVELGIDTPSSFCLRDANGAVIEQGVVPAIPPAREGWEPLFSEQLRNFAAAIRGEEAVYADAADGRRVVDLIQKCYAARSPAAFPWREIGAL